MNNKLLLLSFYIPAMAATLPSTTLLHKDHFNLHNPGFWNVIS